MTSIRDNFQSIKDYVGLRSTDLRINSELIDILEGNLYYYVDELLRRQLSPESYKEARHRIAPINLLRKIIDKLSTIYTPGPLRTIQNANDDDKEMFEWYQKNSNVNKTMKSACENYSLGKAALLQPLMHEQKLLIRNVQNGDFVVRSTDPVDPLNPTEVIALMGTPEATEYLVWTKEEVLKFKPNGDVDNEYLASINNPNGENVYKHLSFVYINSSTRKLMPPADLDLKTIVCLVPLLFSDLNYAVMFQCFSILYGIDVDDAGLKRAPNAFWNIKSDQTTDAKPQVGVIKPDVDIDQVLGLIQSELSLFLNSRGIKPGSIGSLNKDSFASGISKLVDEIDTVELRQKLVTVFMEAERKLWDFIIHVGHPVWIRDEAEGMPFTKNFSKDCYVDSKFAEQLPLTSRGQVVKDLKAEVDAGFTTKKRAIQTLNPEMSEDKLEELFDELEEEKEEQSNGSEMATDSSDDTEGSDGGRAGLDS